MSKPEFLPFTKPTLDEETIQSVAEVLRSGWITSGPKVLEFEQALSEHFGGRPVRVANSATAALEIGLRLMGVGPGDEVITTPLTWVATVNVILKVGATPVLVDIDPQTRNIDLNLLEKAITPKTRALLPVDLAGLPVDRQRLYNIAKAHGLRVLEDAAQSQGATSHGERIGTHGDLCSVSFHPNKNITSIEGGALVMNTPEEAREFEKWRLQGVERLADGTMDVTLPGGKCNLTDVAAAVGLGQLKRIVEFNTKRTRLAHRYFDRLNPNLGLTLPVWSDDSNWHMFQPLLPLDRMKFGRGEFINRMKALGVGVGVHYPALHLFTMFRAMGYTEGQYPVAEQVGASTVSLPLFPGMSPEDVDRVCNAIEQVMKEALA